MSARLYTWKTGSDLATAINSLITIKSANAEAFVDSATPLCNTGQVTDTIIRLNAQSGNIPRLGLWTSVVGNYNPNSFTTANSTNPLVLIVQDGRDDSVKLCNGLGKCDFTSGVCLCDVVSIR